MPTSGALSADPRHTIKTVCAQTGLLPVTLRAWERRYHLLQPQRSTGNYRLYSDRDIALLRWVKQRVDDGAAIRLVAAELHALRRAGQWPEAVPRPPSAPSAEPPAPPEAYCQRLYVALVAMNEAQAADILHGAEAVFDVAAICLDIIQPCLYAVGEAWYRGAVRVATEHFASQYLRGRLLTLLQAYPVRRGAPRVVVGCAPNEFHDIGSLILALFLRREGYRVEFLGANVHLDDLRDHARAERPALICLSANSEATARALRQMEACLAELTPRPQFAFGGWIFNHQPSLRKRVPGLFLGEDAQQAVDQARVLLPL